jgi:hypothetical protein
MAQDDHPMTVDEFKAATTDLHLLLDHFAATLNWVAEQMYRDAEHPIEAPPRLRKRTGDDG